LLFSGEAYNVEMGITNELFQNERNSDPACQFKVTPNDSTPLVSENTASPSASFQNDIDLFAAFMRFSAPPTPASAAATPVAQATGGSNVAAGQTTGTATGASTTSSSASTTSSSASTASSPTSTVVASATADVSSVMATAAGASTAQPSSSA